MSVVRQKTLGEVRHSLAVRLGYGAQGSVSATQRPILDGFINDAQAQLARQYTDVMLNKIVDDGGMFNSGQVLYDIPSAADPLGIKEMLILINDCYLPLCFGIDGARNTALDARPYYWEILSGTTGQPQIEVWPAPIESNGYRLVYQPEIKELVNADDHLSIDSHAVFLLALVNAKNHYQQKDAEGIANQLDMYVGKIRYLQHGNRRYRIGQKERYDLDGVDLFEAG